MVHGVVGTRCRFMNRPGADVDEMHIHSNKWAYSAGNDSLTRVDFDALPQRSMERWAQRTDNLALDPRQFEEECRSPPIELPI